MRKHTIFPCPAKHTPIIEPVVIAHPKLAGYIYDKASVLAAAQSGELLKFGITSENVLRYIFLDHFTAAIIERIKNNKLILKSQQLREALVVQNINDDEDDTTDLSCPITRSVVTGVGALCLIDGRMYDLDMFKKWLQHMPISPMSHRSVNLLADVIEHPVHKLIMDLVKQHPDDLINLKNVLTNYQQPKPVHLDMTMPMPYSKLRTYSLIMLMVDAVFDHGKFLLASWQVPANNLAPIWSQELFYALPVASAIIDIRFQLSLARQAVWTRLNLNTPYILLAGDPIQELVGQPKILLPSWFIYSTFVMKVYLVKNGFTNVILPGFGTQQLIGKLGSYKMTMVREYFVMYRQFELLRAFSQINIEFVARLHNRFILNAGQSISLRSIIKRIAEALLILGMAAIYVHVIVSQLDNVGHYGRMAFDSTLGRLLGITDHPIAGYFGKMLLYPLTVALSWPDLCTMLIAMHNINETLFGTENLLPGIFNINFTLLMCVALMLLPIMNDYSFSSVMDYLTSLIILGTKIVVQDVVEQQLPRVNIGERYRLMSPPTAERVVEEPEVGLELKKNL